MTSSLECLNRVHQFNNQYHEISNVISCLFDYIIRDLSSIFDSSNLQGMKELRCFSSHLELKKI